jgi:hypothetical protein
VAPRTTTQQDETFSIGLGIGVGKAVGAVASRAFGFGAGLFGRTASTAAVEAGTDVLAGKVLTGFSEAEAQMIQKSLSALEAAGYNTGKLETFIRITDARATGLCRNVAWGRGRVRGQRLPIAGNAESYN